MGRGANRASNKEPLKKQEPRHWTRFRKGKETSAAPLPPLNEPVTAGFLGTGRLVRKTLPFPITHFCTENPK
jgi:hypothetical protein